MNPSVNAERPGPCQDPASDAALSNAINAAPTVARRRRPRHDTGQLPLVYAADVHEPRPGRRKATILPHDPQCPKCGYQRSHLGDWPAPALITRRCPGCGLVTELMLRVVKAGQGARRRRRAA